MVSPLDATDYSFTTYSRAEITMSLRNCWFIVLGLIMSPRLLAAEVETPQEFKRNALIAWNDLLGRVSAVRVERHIEIYSSRDGKPLALSHKGIARDVFNQAGELTAGDDESFDKNGEMKERSSALSIWNDQYHAGLMKGKTQQDWLLTKHVPGKQGAPARLGIAFPWLTLGHIPLFEWIPDPCFEIIRLETREDGTSTLLRVHFQNSTRSSPGPSNAIKDGYIEFDRARS